MDPKGARLLTVHAYGKPCLPPVHKYSSLRSPPRIVQQAAVLDAAIHALRRQCSSEGSMSNFKSIT